MPNQPDPKSNDHGGDADSRRRDAAGVLAPGLLAETYVVFFTMEKQKLNNMVLVKYFYNLLQQGLCQRVVLQREGTLIAVNYYFAAFFPVISLNVLYCLYS